MTAVTPPAPLLVHIKSRLYPSHSAETLGHFTYGNFSFLLHLYCSSLTLSFQASSCQSTSGAYPNSPSHNSFPEYVRYARYMKHSDKTNDVPIQMKPAALKLLLAMLVTIAGIGHAVPTDPITCDRCYIAWTLCDDGWTLIDNGPGCYICCQN